MKSFASDNYSGANSEIMQAIINANHNHAVSYGDDPFTMKAATLLNDTFGGSAKVYFVYNGTAGNTLALKALTKSYNSIICADSAHIVTQETGAVTNFTGCSLVPIQNKNGKITADAIENTYLQATSCGKHSPKPNVVSIAQPTEYGTVYSLEELSAISSVCKKYDMFFYMDGCRLANAAVALNKTLKETTTDVGIDALTFGGAKNGLLFGESIIFLKKDLANEFDYIHKQGLQLHSKMRFISAQFIPYIEEKIWYKNAVHANHICRQLAERLTSLKEVELAYPIQTNQIFAYFSKSLIEKTQEKFPYYTWDKKSNLVRLVTGFDSTAEDIETFLRLASA